MKIKSVILMGCSQILALWLFGNILRVNAQDSAIQPAPLPHFTQQISPPNSDTLKDSWIILLIEVSAYGLQYEYANKLLGPHPNEQKPNFMMVNAEYVLESESAKKLLDAPLN